MNEAVKDKIAEWLAWGETGISSETMALYLGFGKLPSDYSHPYDPADFNRCLMLLDKVPELRAELPRMTAVSPTWAALVNRWEDIERMFVSEVGVGWRHGKRAPRTYEMMVSVRASAERGA